MTILDRVGKAEGVLAFWDRVLRWGPTILGATATGWIAGWAGAATAVLTQYSPLSWVVTSMLGVCGFLCAAWLWSAARVNAVRLEFSREQAKRPVAINPLEPVFTKQRIELHAFRSQFNEAVTGKTFVDCDLYGPAVIFLAGNVSMSHVGIAACEFVRVRDGAKVYNSIPFVDLTVTRGKMRGLTILVPASAVERVDAGVADIQWITH